MNVKDGLSKLNLLRDRIYARFSIRPMIGFIQRHYPRHHDGFVGVEIGVYYGFNSRNILCKLPMKKLYLIDPYGTYIQKGDVVFEKTKKYLSVFHEKIEFVRKTSEDAVDDVPNDLDFVYIDGNHEYEYVMQDIMLYYPKVKKGGIIGGHDFDGSHPDVCRAVVELCREKDLDLHTGGNDWWVRKK
jgi:hypothetical protein